MDDMNDFESCAKGSGSYEQIKVIVDINNSMLWAQDTRCYEKLMDMDDMKDFGSWAQGCS